MRRGRDNEPNREGLTELFFGCLSESETAWSGLAKAIYRRQGKERVLVQPKAEPKSILPINKFNYPDLKTPDITSNPQLTSNDKAILTAANCLQPYINEQPLIDNIDELTLRRLNSRTENDRSNLINLMYLEPAQILQLHTGYYKITPNA